MASYNKYLPSSQENIPSKEKQNHKSRQKRNLMAQLCMHCTASRCFTTPQAAGRSLKHRTSLISLVWATPLRVTKIALH